MSTEAQENVMVKLDEDFLAELEEAAKNRYTEEDEDFMKVCSSPPVKPPIQPAEPHNQNRRGGDRFRGNRNRGGWHDRRSGGYRDDRRHDYHGGRHEGQKDDRRHDYRDDRRQGYGGHGDDRRQDYGGFRGNRRNAYRNNRDDRRQEYGNNRDDKREDGYKRSYPN